MFQEYLIKCYISQLLTIPEPFRAKILPLQLIAVNLFHPKINIPKILSHVWLEPKDVIYHAEYTYYIPLKMYTFTRNSCVMSGIMSCTIPLNIGQRLKLIYEVISGRFMEFSHVGPSITGIFQKLLHKSAVTHTQNNSSVCSCLLCFCFIFNGIFQ